VTVYKSQQEQTRAWADAAAAKLRADNVDPTDTEAVKACLSGCVGSVYEPWLEVYGEAQ